jgi:myo-inositol-1(or 4)-monophosphatase
MTSSHPPRLRLRRFAHRSRTSWSKLSPSPEAQARFLRAGFAQLTTQRAAPEMRFKSSEFDPVTEFDHRSEAFIVAALQRAFPEHRIVGEEGGAYAAPAAGDGELICEWHVDPLDGTVNFAHGFPAFAVSLGLLVDGCQPWGVVYDPMADEMFSAAHGMGALETDGRSASRR